MLPYEHVRSTFDTLCQEADNANDPRLDRLTAYMRNTWMESTMWKISEWVVFMEPVQQVSLKKLKKYQCERHRSVQGRLFTYWGDYAEGRRTTSSLLRTCSRVYAPVVEEDCEQSQDIINQPENKEKSTKEMKEKMRSGHVERG
ncbi:Hypp8303 [Branchiostoma lanceolatum]|uniref:Hypp8303 protein n=1 Tax=Branchiostoma lanceolatum TaxID=7740 RepID=A0A8J9Z7A1_BRALA|nr:Hypp8303 [Branchiostoma lanceolatum]